MDSPSGQPRQPPDRGAASTATRQRLLRAAAELIAEVGWGRVTTRAVASRANLPHGTVSYHFRGKQDLLTETALHTFQRTFPVAELEALGTLSGLIGVFERWLGEGTMDPVVSGVGMEAMLEAERNPLLREGMADMLRAYRRLLTEIVRAEQQRGVAPAGVSPAAVAALVVAVGDGLFLHARLDCQLDVGAALEGLRALVTR